jgi:hypothetical protein
MPQPTLAPVPEPLSLADAHRLFSKIVTGTYNEQRSHYLFGIGYNNHNKGLYVIAIPYASTAEADGPVYLCATEAFYVTEEATIGSKIKHSSVFLLMSEGNRWEWA